MLPTGGLSIVVHVVVIVTRAVYGLLAPRKLRLIRVPAAVVLASVSVVILAGASLLLANAFVNESNFDHLAFATMPCVSRTAPYVSSRTVVIRIDDIQAHAWSSVQRRMINDALELAIPVSLSIIPYRLRSDAELYSFLRSVRCDVEFALHGWDNREPRAGRGEFAFLDERLARRRIVQGLQVLDRLSRTEVVTFVPPLNELSVGTERAIEKLDIPVISSFGSGPFDYDAATFDFVVDRHVTAEQTITECVRTFVTETTCIVMVHPQDYVRAGVLDPIRYREFTRLLEGLLASGYSFARFSDLVEAETSYPVAGHRGPTKRRRQSYMSSSGIPRPR